MRLTSPWVRLSFAVALLGGGPARAEQAAATAESAREVAPRNYGNLRIGASTSSHRPTLCLELSPLELLSVEACGNGSGFLHHEEAPELAHFRAHFTLASWKTPLGWLQPRLSAGFAELQVGEDGSGFHFGGTGPSGVETAPRLLQPQAAFQPTASFTLGVGF